MTSNRRKFLQKAGALSAVTFFSSLAKPLWARNFDMAIRNAEGMSAADLATDDDFWYYIQQCFTSASVMINLNNGGMSPAPKVVQDAMKRYYDYSNELPSYNMTRLLDDGKEPLRRNLARLSGCNAEEICLNRNATEGLQTVIFGLQLKAGDEIVAAKQDYPSMISAYQQREVRDGIKMVWINLDLPSEDESYMVNQYVKAFTPKTKVVHITHMINWTGQILPVAKIAKEAHKRGIEVIVDGAHSFLHFDFTIPGLEADYFAASLHKWMFAPIGTGMLYIKKEKIRSLYPLFAAEDPFKDDIRKLEHLGTHPVFIQQAIVKAIEFHDMIGIERKQHRLQYLKNYWMEKVKILPKIKLNTSLDPKWGCAIGSFAVEGKDAKVTEDYLLKKHRIHTIGVNRENIHGVRVTPNVYTTIHELDLLVKGITEFLEVS